MGINMNKLIIAISSHFDDAEIGCSGTLIKHIENNDTVRIVILKCDEELTGDSKTRIQEQISAINKITKNRKQLEFISYKHDDDNEYIIGEIDKLKPDILFVPWEFDTHQDHRRASVIGQAVGRKREISTYFYSSGSTYDFYPNVFSPIDFEKKLEVLNCFKTQVECGAIKLDLIEKRESFWASMISTEIKHVEGFVARKVIYSYDN